MSKEPGLGTCRHFPEDIFDAVFSPDGRWLLANDLSGKKVTLVDLARVLENTETASIDIDLSASYGFVFFSPDSKWMVASGFGVTGLWDLRNPQASPSLFLPEENLSDIAFFPEDKYIVGLKTSDGPTDYYTDVPPVGSQIWIWQVAPRRIKSLKLRNESLMYHHRSVQMELG